MRESHIHAPSSTVNGINLFELRLSPPALEEGTHQESTLTDPDVPRVFELALLLTGPESLNYNDSIMEGVPRWTLASMAAAWLSTVTRRSTWFIQANGYPGKTGAALVCKGQRRHFYVENSSSCRNLRPLLTSDAGCERLTEDVLDILTSVS